MNVVPFVPMPLGIVVSFPLPSVARIAVAGEIDIATGPVVVMRLFAVLQVHRPTVMEIDLGNVTFLDCAGIGQLIAARASAAMRPCELWITGTHGMVERFLAVTGLLAGWTAPAAAGAVARRGRWWTRLGRRTRPSQVAADSPAV